MQCDDSLSAWFSVQPIVPYQFVITSRNVFSKAFNSVNQRFWLEKLLLVLCEKVVRREEHKRRGLVIRPLLFLLFVNDLPRVIFVLTLLFANGAKMVSRRSQSGHPSTMAGIGR